MFEPRQIFSIVFDDDGTRTIYKVRRSIFRIEWIVQRQFRAGSSPHFRILSGISWCMFFPGTSRLNAHQIAHRLSPTQKPTDDALIALDIQSAVRYE